MLKHTDAIRKTTGADVVDLTTACLGQLRHIERKERANRLRDPRPHPRLKRPLNRLKMREKAIQQSDTFITCPGRSAPGRHRLAWESALG